MAATTRLSPFARIALVLEAAIADLAEAVEKDGARQGVFRRAFDAPAYRALSSELSRDPRWTASGTKNGLGRSMWSRQPGDTLGPDGEAAWRRSTGHQQGRMQSPWSRKTRPVDRRR